MKKLINKISLAVVTFLINITSVFASSFDTDPVLCDGLPVADPPFYEIVKEFFLQAFLISLLISSIISFFIGKSKKLFIALFVYLTVAILLIMHPSTHMELFYFSFVTIPIFVYIYFYKKLKIALYQKIHLFISLAFLLPFLLYYILRLIFGSISMPILLLAFLLIALGVHFYDLRKNWKIIFKIHFINIILIIVFILSYTCWQLLTYW